MHFPYLSYEERSLSAESPCAKTFFSLMAAKETNLAIAADVLHAEELLKIADELGPSICLLKTHIDILRDFSFEVVVELQALAEKHKFFIFEDRKFADIGQTVKYQYEEGIYRISSWAHLTNAHALPGIAQIESLREVGLPKERGLLLIAEMSSKGHLLTPEYCERTITFAKTYPDFVVGFITQHAIDRDYPGWIYMAPGIHLDSTNDRLGQQYVSPKDAIMMNGIDVIIVGRGIIKAKNRQQEAERYRHEAFKAYLDRMRLG